jgi:homoserine dehydrogenase
VISGLQDGLAGDELFKIYGILNGTCNYVLSKVESSGMPFSSALAEAQELGFAEADPSDDINGLDARAKITILTRIGLHSQVKPTDIVCRSIASVEAVDFDYAKQLGSTIRQISRAELKGEQAEPGPLFASVQPALVELASPLAQVQGGQNLVVSTGKFGGETIFGGHGAGGNPTAVAIVSDLIAVTQGQKELVPRTPVPSEIERTVSADFTTRHYLRFTVKDRPGIIAALAEIFSSCAINIDSVLQKPGYPKSSLPFVITLEASKTSLVERACLAIAQLDFLLKPCLHLPILD